jgi:O-antigen/teichoic acid export membrane protein
MFLGKLIRKGIPFTLVAFFVGIYYYIDTVMLSMFTDSKTVGYYNAAYRLLEAPLFLSAAFTTAIFPAVSKLFVENKEYLQKTIRESLEKILIIGVLIAITVGYYSKDIINIFYGAEYSNSSTALTILIVSVAIIMPSTVLGTTLRAMNKQAISAYVTGGGAALNIILNLILIPRYSLLGAAWATVATEVFVIVIYANIVWHYIGPIAHFSYIVRTGLFISLIFLFLYLSNNINVYLQLFFLFSMVSICPFLLRIFNLSDIKTLFASLFFMKKKVSQNV